MTDKDIAFLIISGLVMGAIVTIEIMQAITSHKNYYRERERLLLKEAKKDQDKKEGERVIMIHQLKLQASFFEEKIKGLKPWELRLNDRGFKVGDYIGENEVIDKDGEWCETGRFVLEKITNIVYHEECAGLEKGWVILTTNPCKVVARGQILADVDNAWPVYGGDNNAEPNTRQS